jgi:hypothetical protein
MARNIKRPAREFVARVPSACLFPITAARKAPPLFNSNLNLASNEPERIAQWSANFPGCNWGLATKKSGLIVMDVDTNEAKSKVGASTLFDLEMKHELPGVGCPNGGVGQIEPGQTGR